jgi:hypothetical protein
MVSNHFQSASDGRTQQTGNLAQYADVFSRNFERSRLTALRANFAGGLPTLHKDPLTGSLSPDR